VDIGVVNILGADDLGFAVPIDISSHDPLATTFCVEQNTLPGVEEGGGLRGPAVVERVEVHGAVPRELACDAAKVTRSGGRVQTTP
jgi:hypothetical protein